MFLTEIRSPGVKAQRMREGPWPSPDWATNSLGQDKTSEVDYVPDIALLRALRESRSPWASRTGRRGSSDVPEESSKG